MMFMRRRLTCCTREREISFDFDEQERIVTYNGLESCVINNQSYEDESGTSRGDGCPTDSLDDDAFSSCSSSKDPFGSFSSKWLPTKSEEQGSDEWELTESQHHAYAKEKPAYALTHSDVETMKEKFSKLLLGEDVTGGSKGVNTALALSNAITNLAASVFGELWKLEPLPEERKRKWQREIDWLLSPTNYMIELVPARQNGTSGQTIEILTPKARPDIHVNLPALQKLDSMLIETLDSMVDTEFWYVEVGSRAEGRNKSTRESKRWWLPSPQVPKPGLSEPGRKQLLCKGNIVHQVFKAAKSINEAILREMPVPTMIKDAIPKSGKANLGDELYRLLTAESISATKMLNSINLATEHGALETVNKLEAAMLAWKERMAEQMGEKSPLRTSWSFMRDPLSEVGRLELLTDRAEALKQQIKARYPNLPQTFLDATKIQYGKDIGHSILEAYSRVLENLAFSILSRLGEVLKEDALSNPNTPVAPSYFPGMNTNKNSESPVVPSRVRHSLIDKMNSVDKRKCSFDLSKDSNAEIRCRESKGNSVNATPSRGRAWCMSRETCISLSPRHSP